MKLYTRTGDDGTTALFGGRRVRKDALRVEAYGAVDETNAALGMARSQGLDIEIDKVVADLQLDLFASAPTSRRRTTRGPIGAAAIDDADVAALEALIDRFDEEVEPLRQFIVPGRSRGQRRPAVRPRGLPAGGARRGDAGGRGGRQPGHPDVPQPLVRPAVRAGAGGQRPQRGQRDPLPRAAPRRRRDRGLSARRARGRRPAACGRSARGVAGAR
jgi:hypothetical protein